MDGEVDAMMVGERVGGGGGTGAEVGLPVVAGTLTLGLELGSETGVLVGLVVGGEPAVVGLFVGGGLATIVGTALGVMVGTLVGTSAGAFVGSFAGGGGFSTGAVVNIPAVG